MEYNRRERRKKLKEETQGKKGYYVIDGRLASNVITSFLFKQPTRNLLRSRTWNAHTRRFPHPR
jgi:hypothetical protein